MDNMSFASSVILTMTAMLKDRYTDKQIVKMLSSKNIKGTLKILNEKEEK